MSKILSGWLLLTLLVGGQVFAVADGPDFWQTREGERVRMHARPDLHAPVIEHIPPGRRGLPNLGCEGQVPFREWSAMTPEQQAAAREGIWCKTHFNEKPGWVQGKYLEEQAGSAPSFDCKEAASQVEELICNDVELARLDILLHSVFGQSVHAAGQLDDRSEQVVQQLRATQHGWVKGRNDCWKAHDVRQCTADQYQRRISELQAQWSLVQPGRRLQYRCKDQSEFFLTLFNTPLLPTAAVEYGDRREVLLATRTASGSRYDGQSGRYVWLKGREATLVQDQNLPAVHCTRVGD